MSFTGKQHSLRTRRLISQKTRGRRLTEHTRKQQSIGHQYSLIDHAHSVGTRIARHARRAAARRTAHMTLREVFRARREGGHD
jgi:hypothetical protein